MRRRVKPYVPLPLRCSKCQRFGHHAANCCRKQRCVRCGQEHDLDQCPTKDNSDQITCVNCNGQHSAAYRGCTKYKEVSQTLKVAVNEGLSYKDAITKVRSNAEDQRFTTSTPRGSTSNEVSEGRYALNNRSKPTATIQTDTSAEGITMLESRNNNKLFLAEFTLLPHHLNMEHVKMLLKTITLSLLWTVQSIPHSHGREAVEKQLKFTMSIITSSNQEEINKCYTDLLADQQNITTP